MLDAGGGIFSVVLSARRVNELRLPEQEAARRRGSRRIAGSIDAREGTTTGISATERALTARVAADPATRPVDLVVPGHVPPLIAADAGVFVARELPEAALDLVRLAGGSAAAICAILDAAGATASPDEVRARAAAHGLPLVDDHRGRRPPDRRRATAARPRPAPRRHPPRRLHRGQLRQRGHRRGARGLGPRRGRGPGRGAARDPLLLAGRRPSGDPGTERRGEPRPDPAPLRPRRGRRPDPPPRRRQRRSPGARPRGGDAAWSSARPRCCRSTRRSRPAARARDRGRPSPQRPASPLRGSRTAAAASTTKSTPRSERPSTGRGRRRSCARCRGTL